VARPESQAIIDRMVAEGVLEARTLQPFAPIDKTQRSKEQHACGLAYLRLFKTKLCRVVGATG
jgi:hypothetical protein